MANSRKSSLIPGDLEMLTIKQGSSEATVIRRVFSDKSGVYLIKRSGYVNPDDFNHGRLGRVAEFYPATGSYAWKVGRSVGGKLFEPGEGYVLSIASYDGGFGIFDESDRTFLITRCIG